MRITVFGAGATGGHFAAKLARAGHAVSVVARGAHLDAIARDGLTLVSGAERFTASVRAAADATSLGPQDVVVVGVKATGLANVADALRPLVGPDTLVVFPQNGMPWWYSVGLVDKPVPPDLPDFALAARYLDYMSPEQLVGGSIYSANALEAPGVVRNVSPASNRIDLGPVVTGEAPGLGSVRAAFEAVGVASPPVPDIRVVIWRKLLANMSGSIIALVTGNRSSIARRDPELGALYRRVVKEGLAIAAAHGFDLADDVDIDAMLARIAEHKPSILQDYEAGRPMEIAQIVIAPQAFARKAGLETPVLDTLAAVAARLAADRGLYVPGV